MKRILMLVFVGLMTLMTSEIMAQCAGGRCSGGRCQVARGGYWYPTFGGWYYYEQPIEAETVEPEELTPAEEKQLEEAPVPDACSSGICPPINGRSDEGESSDENCPPRLGAFREIALARINAFRSSAGLPPLELDEGLCAACSNHCARMASWGFAHDPYGGREVIAWGVSTPEGAVAMWMNSPAHANILRGQGRKLGIGFYGSFWTARIR